MPNFEALPNELLARVISFLDKQSLAEMRLVNKRLEQISVKRLFARITLYAHLMMSAEATQLRWALLGDSDSDEVQGNNSTRMIQTYSKMQTGTHI
jgi:hypothetical protein